MTLLTPSRRIVALVCASCGLATVSACAQAIWPEPRPEPPAFAQARSRRLKRPAMRIR